MLTILVLAVGCSAHEEGVGEQTDQTQSESDAPIRLDGYSVPIPGTKVTGSPPTSYWDYSSGELVVADALTACTTNGADQPIGTWVTDESLKDLRSKMDATSRKFNAQDPPSWLALRKNSKLNFRPLTGSETAVTFRTHYPSLYDFSTFQKPPLGRSGQASERAQKALNVAAVNLCTARGLNEQMQLGWNVLMAASDQRYLLETVRERSQLAMLQLADIAVTLQSDELNTSIADSAYGFREFATTGIGPGGMSASSVLKEWAKDLADSVRIHVIATQRLSRLLARSAGARDPFPGVRNTQEVDDFRPASWRQRLLALLYGGDPLESALRGTPGAAPVVRATPSATKPGWPTDEELPYAPSGVWTPGAIRFLQAAQQNDSLALLLKSTAADYVDRNDIDRTLAAEWLYRDLEAAIQTRACIPAPASPTTAETTCPVIMGDDASKIPAQIPYSADKSPDESKLGAWSVWNTYQLQPEDAGDLVNALASVLPSVNKGGGFHIVGGTQLVALPGRSAKSVHFDPMTKLVPRSLLEAQSIYGRMGRHRTPSILQDSLYLATVYDGGGDKSGVLLDAGRLMGAIPALATVRESLDILTTSAAIGAQPFKDEERDSIASFLKAAIGDSRISLQPSESVATVGGAPVVVQTTSGTNRFWTVRIQPSAGDPFWSSTPSNYTVFAILDTPQALNAVADTTAARAGFQSLATILSTGTVVNGAALVKDTTGKLSTTLSLPENSTAVFVARRRAGSRFEYRALTGAVAPWPVQLRGSDGSSVALPGDARYFVTSGDLTTIALQANAVTPLDPAMPFYDGFGEPRSRMPSRANVMDSQNASIREFFNRALDDARIPIKNAETSLRKFTNEILTDAYADIRVKEVREREKFDLQQTFARLCGTETPTPDSLCNIDFVSVNSMGPTESEMKSFGCSDSDRAGAPTTTPSPNWSVPPDVDCAAVTQSDLGNRVACSLAARKGVFSFPMQMAKPIACKAWQRGVNYGNSDIGILLKAQHQAYWNYRDTVTGVGLAGQPTLVDFAKASVIQRDLGNSKLSGMLGRYDSLKNSGNTLWTLRELTWKVREQQAEVNRAAARVVNAEDIIISGTLFASGRAKAGYEKSAPIGTAIFPGVGPYLGGAEVTVSALGSLFGGMSGSFSMPLEEVRRAPEQFEHESRKLAELQVAEKDLANHFRLCAHGGDPNSKWGACPAGPIDEKAMDYYYTDKELDGERSRCASLPNVLAGFASQTKQFGDAVVAAWMNADTLWSSTTSIRKVMQNVQLDVERIKLEQRLVLDRNRGEFAIEHAFQSSNAYEVAGNMDIARRALGKARRVLEFAYAMDLTNMTRSNDPDAAAPNAWIDQLYDYDYRPLVLLSGQPRDSGFEAEKLSKYADSLVAARNAHENLYNLTIDAKGAYSTLIPGPSASRTVVVPTEPGPGTKPVSVPDPEGAKWSVKCNAGSACAPEGGWCAAPRATVDANGVFVPASFATVCAPPAGSNAPTVMPSYAKVGFYLDRWANKVGTRGQNFNLLNGRWNQVAVNLESPDTVRVCGPQDPSTCASGKNAVTYDLYHEGPYITTGADRLLHVVPYFPTTVGGKALDEALLIDVNRSDTGGLADLTDYWLRDLFAAPLGGRYELVIRADFSTDGRPLDLGKLRAVQIVSYQPIYFHSTPPSAREASTRKGPSK